VKRATEKCQRLVPANFWPLYIKWCGIARVLKAKSIIFGADRQAACQKYIGKAAYFP
jgi:hypothetical protein